MKRYLVFGGTGSLGKKLINRLSTNNQVFVSSRDELKQWTLRNDFSEKTDIIQPQFFVGDIRDYDRVKDIIRQVAPDIIIIAAALKQIDTCELSPMESIQTNLLGTQNVIKAVNEQVNASVNTILFVSTDKACQPVSSYGMCKAMSERLVTSQAKTGPKNIRFLCTRYGNVLESRGSIIPLFKYQSERSESLTVTDPNMTRFVMTLDDSVDLILTAIENGKSGETWIPVIPAMKIGDIAQIFSEKTGKPIKIIGLRPGEKQHEDLISNAESVRSYMHNNTHHVIGPAYLQGNNKAFTYTSADDVMTKEQLKEHLIKLGVLDMSLDQFPGQKIEEIITNRKK